MADLMTDLRKLNDERDKRIREAADPDCRICKGKGTSANYIAPGKVAYPACRCTGIPGCE